MTAKSKTATHRPTERPTKTANPVVKKALKPGVKRATNKPRKGTP